MEALPEIQQRRLVIAIDYGTTYTGVAYATPAGHRAYLQEIDLLQDWTLEMANLDKIPSVYSYSPASEALEQQWGANLSLDAVAMVHTKLELDVHDTSEELDFVLDTLDGMHNLHFQYIRAAGGLPAYAWKTPEKIVEDYLAKVFDTVNGHLSEIFVQEVRSLMPVDIVITIPAKWSYRAKNSTFRALTRAGFNKDAFPTLMDMLLISEPEAAAVYTARYLKEEEGAGFLKKGECFALCDAGGGTVDVVSYKVKELEPFELERVTLPTGHNCGSIFIDLAFKTWLKDLIGEQNYVKLDQTQLVHKISTHNSEGRPMRELMKEFKKLKLDFTKEHRGKKIDLPEPLHNLDIHNRVNKGEITITNKIMRSFFDPCVDDIIKLILGQIAQVDRLGTRLRNIFLVGGFAESEYVQEEIRYSLRLRKIQMRRPDTSWTAVVRGGAIFGIEKSANKALSTMTACPRYYGIAVTESFSDIRHPREHSIEDPKTKRFVAKERLMWLIMKGDVILSDAPREIKHQLTKTFTQIEPRRGKLTIYAYEDDDDVPETFYNSENDLKKVCTLEYDLSDISVDEFTRQQPSETSQPFYVTSIRLEMIMDSHVIKVELHWRDTSLCRTNINYLQ